METQKKDMKKNYTETVKGYSYGDYKVIVILREVLWAIK